jgi:hypothetical protein
MPLTLQRQTWRKPDTKKLSPRRHGGTEKTGIAM